MKPTHLALLPALCAVLACQAAERALELDIAAGRIDEVCLPVKAGTTIHWRFTSDAPVAFNLHHHVGQQVFMPVDVKATRAHEGRHTVDRANEWCLMWTAPKDRPAAVRGGFATDDIVR